MDSRNSLVRSDESMLTTVVGLDDVIVVSTADAVLVASRGSTAAFTARCPLPCEAHRREAQQHALVTKTLSPVRALRGRERNS
jgi:mannose-1-phosphate guanylyltransferase/mannose-6-phosphate isomerase